jgi:hypothetical protein
MRVDRSALRTNQACIIALSVIAFLLGTDRGGQWLILFVAASMALDTAFPGTGPFKQLYARVVKPSGLLKPDVRAEDPAPHRFAQGLGAGFLFASFAFLVGGVEVVGWALAWIVIALALINLTVDFCAGCFIYLQLGRLGILPRHREAA